MDYALHLYRGLNPSGSLLTAIAAEKPGCRWRACLGGARTKLIRFHHLHCITAPPLLCFRYGLFRPKGMLPWN